MVDTKQLGLWFLTALWTIAGLTACSGTSGKAMAPAGAISVAVWDFENLSPGGGEREAMGELLAAQVAAHLEQAGPYRLVERKDLLRVMEELNLGSSQLADADTRLRLGHMIGARQMVFGAFQVFGHTMRLDLRRVDVASGKVLKTAKGIAADDNAGSWLNAADQAAAELVNP